jgi:hypothetical protein
MGITMKEMVKKLPGANPGLSLVQFGNSATLSLLKDLGPWFCVSTLSNGLPLSFERYVG